MERRLVPAVSPFAATVGYSRAVRDGRDVHVAGALDRRRRCEIELEALLPE